MEDTTCRCLCAALNEGDNVLMCHEGFILARRSCRSGRPGFGREIGNSGGISMEGGRSYVFQIQVALKGVRTMLGYHGVYYFCIFRNNEQVVSLPLSSR